MDPKLLGRVLKSLKDNGAYSIKIKLTIKNLADFGDDTVQKPFLSFDGRVRNLLSIVIINETEMKLQYSNRQSIFLFVYSYNCLIISKNNIIGL